MFQKRISSKYNIFYGWIIVGTGFILMAVAMGIAFNCASLFLKPVSEDLLFSRQEVGVTITIRFACQAIIALISGKIFRKYNLKRLMQISALLLPISYYSYSFTNSLISYYLITVLVSISVVLLTILPLSLIINNWFHERQGFAIGLAFMGSGFGGMIFNSLTGVWLTKVGWRLTYKYLAAIMFLTIIPCVFFLIFIHPRELGLSALGEVEYDERNKGKIEEEGFLLAEAKKTKKFWLICICSMTVTMSINNLLLNIAPHLTDIGYSTVYSANIVALSMAALAIFKVVLGILYDKLGLRIATTLACFAILLGFVGLIYANYSIAMLVIIICVGFGSALGTIANPVIARETFGLRDYSSIYGVLTAFSAVGGMISPMGVGYIYDRTGSYNSAFIYTIGIISVTIVIYQFIFPKNEKEIIE